MIVDGCSGAVVGWSVALSETAVAVADALRHGMTHFPPPLGYYSDIGEDGIGRDAAGSGFKTDCGGSIEDER